MPRKTPGRAQHVTFCTVCNREVGVAQNWNRWQQGQTAEWRVARHSVAPPQRGVKAAICSGTGISVQAEKVLV
jgi:hypothetical protein